MELRRLRADEGLAYRAIRLRALETEPTAYAQTRAEAIADPEQTWHGLAASVAGDDPRALFVLDRGQGDLAATLYAAISDVPPHLGRLGAMWLDEDVRAQGWADVLMETAIDAGHLHARIEAVQAERDAWRAEVSGCRPAARV